MDFDILDVIEEATKEADAFEHHPVIELEMEEQVLYLNGLALVMNADGHIDDTEKEYIRILIKSIGLGESVLDVMVAFATAPDKDTVQAFFRAFRRKPIAQLFLFDALMMTRRDGKVEDKEMAVVNKIANQLEILKGTQQDIFDLFCHIKNRNWQESALYFSSHLLNPNHFKHLLAYHEVVLDELMAETIDIRAARLLAALKDKMPEPEAGENVKPKLNSEIVLPMLQAEIDRGNAEVVNNQLTIKDSKSFWELDLSSIGFEWNKESASLYSTQQQDITHRGVTEKLIGMLNIDSVSDVIDVLYKGALKITEGSIPTGDNRELKLTAETNKKFPYIELNKVIYKLRSGKHSSYLWGKSAIFTPDGFDEIDGEACLWCSLSDSDIAGHIKKTSKKDVIDALEFVFENGLVITKDNSNKEGDLGA